MNLEGNKILITGGNSGIGLEMVKQLYPLNNSIIITGKDKNRLQNVKEAFPGTDTFQCDFGKKADVESLAAYIQTEHKDLNIVINNAGLQYNYQFAEEKNLLCKIENEIRVNLTAPIQLIALCLPILKENENAAIVNVSSSLGLIPKQSAPVYCGTKAGLHIFTKSLRYQLTKAGIKVFEIIPPLVDTPMTKGRGKNKITTDALVREFLSKFKKDVTEINIGKVRLLKALNRIFPKFAEGMIMKN